MLPKRFFRPDLVKGERALFNAFAGVTDSARFQNCLHLTIFPERSVQGDKGEFDLGRQREVSTFDIDLRNVCA